MLQVTPGHREGGLVPRISLATATRRPAKVSALPLAQNTISKSLDAVPAWTPGRGPGAADLASPPQLVQSGLCYQFASFASFLDLPLCPRVHLRKETARAYQWGHEGVRNLPALRTRPLGQGRTGLQPVRRRRPVARELGA